MIALCPYRMRAKNSDNDSHHSFYGFPALLQAPGAPPGFTASAPILEARDHSTSAGVAATWAEPLYTFRVPEPLTRSSPIELHLVAMPAEEPLAGSSPVGSHPVTVPAEAPLARPSPIGSYLVVAPAESPLVRSSPARSHPVATPFEASLVSCFRQDRVRWLRQ